MAAGFQFDKIWLIESLEQHETPTGRLLRDHISPLLPPSFAIEYVQCGYAGQFIQALDRIVDALRDDASVPLLHVECHGDPAAGLEFANGSEMGWEDLANRLRAVNRASRFNLVAIFSACCGAHFLKKFTSIEAAPAYALIAPHDKVDPGQILGVLRPFYTDLFALRDLGLAVHGLRRHKRTFGPWFGRVAESWFELQICEYAKRYCSAAATDARVRQIFAQVRSTGQYRSLGHIRRQLRAANRQSLTEDLFAQFFMIDAIPSNRERFAGVQKRVRSVISDLRADGFDL